MCVQNRVECFIHEYILRRKCHESRLSRHGEIDSFVYDGRVSLSERSL